MTTITVSEAYRDSSLHLHHIIPLDFDSIRTLPDSHVWPESNDELSGDSLSIPAINLKDPDAPELIGHACETWGVFQVTNHDVPLDLLDQVESETRRLFSLPTTQKLKGLRSPNGVAGYGVARISPFFDKYMWHEGFTIIGSPIDHARELWPNEYQQFCDVMEDYQKKMKVLSTTITRLILKFLDIPEEEMCWVGSQEGINTALQLNSYPFCPDPNRAMGLAPHTDTSLLTVLHQSTVNGLQIFKEGVGWILVRPITGGLLVNVGDFLHILSNARFPSVLHRVVMKEAGRHRLSVAYFYFPPMDFSLSPLGLNSGEVCRYKSVSVKKYIGYKAKNLEKALSLIKNT